MIETFRDIYVVAEQKFFVEEIIESRTWRKLKHNYDVFSVNPWEVEGIDFFMKVKNDKISNCLTEKMSLIYEEKTQGINLLWMKVYENKQTEGLLFVFQEPTKEEPSGGFLSNEDFTDFLIILDENNESFSQRLLEQTFSLSAKLCFAFASSKKGIFPIHSSSIVHNNKTFMFVGESGAGKSTHSKLWLDFIEDTELLNDDYPIIRFDNFGKPIAYGSPWSGKTNCYKNIKAPVKAIVRIKKAEKNRISKLNSIRAYSVMMYSVLGLTWGKDQGNSKHKIMEQIVKTVPCYELECLPDKEAALLCFNVIKQE